MQQNRSRKGKISKMYKSSKLLQLFKTLKKYSSQHFLNPTALYAFLLAHQLVLVLVADGEFSALASRVRILLESIFEWGQARQVPTRGQGWYYPSRGKPSACKWSEMVLPTASPSRGKGKVFAAGERYPTQEKRYLTQVWDTSSRGVSNTSLTVRQVIPSACKSTPKHFLVPPGPIYPVEPRPL